MEDRDTTKILPIPFTVYMIFIHTYMYKFSYIYMEEDDFTFEVLPSQGK